MFHHLTPADIDLAMTPLRYYKACALNPDKDNQQIPYDKAWFTLPPGYQPRLYTNVNDAPHSIETLEDILLALTPNNNISGILDAALTFTPEQWDYLRAAHAGLRRLQYMHCLSNNLYATLHEFSIHSMNGGLSAPLHGIRDPDTPAPQPSIDERYMLTWQISYVCGLLELLQPILQSKPGKIHLTILALHSLCFTGPYRRDWRTCPVNEIYADGNLAWESLSKTLSELYTLDLLLPSVCIRDSMGYNRLRREMHELLGIPTFQSAFSSMLRQFIGQHWRGFSSILAAYCITYAHHLEHAVRMHRNLSDSHDAGSWTCPNRFVPLISNNTDFNRVPVSRKNPGLFLYHASDNVPKHFPRQLVGIVLNKFSHAIVPSFFVRDFCDYKYLLVPTTKRVFRGLLRLYNVPEHDPLVTEDLTTRAVLSTWNDDFQFAVDDLFGLQYAGKVHLRHFIDKTETEPLQNITTDESIISDDDIFHAIYMKHKQSFIKENPIK